MHRGSLHIVHDQTMRSASIAPAKAALNGVLSANASPASIGEPGAPLVIGKTGERIKGATYSEAAKPRRASRLRRVLEAPDDDSAPDSVKVPTLNVAGWWDQEDFYGPVRDLRRARKARRAGHQLSRRRAMAPWRLERRHR